MFKINQFDSNGMTTDWFDAFEQIYNLVKSQADAAL